MFARPQTIDEAVSLLSASPWTIVAGGTDFYPGLRDGPVAGPVLDISAIDGLGAIQRDGDVWRIGAGAAWNDLIAQELPSAFDALKLAAREIGSVQIQNRATVVGNLCNASPAADGVPALLILDAAVELNSQAGRRVLALGDFIAGNRRTARRPDELVTAILVPDAATRGRSHFIKLGARKYLVISIAMVACRLDTDAAGCVSGAAISVGACSEVALRLTALEHALMGRKATAELCNAVAPAHFDALQPIDDVRSSADYRRHAARELVRRSLAHCLQPIAAAA
ncbi:MAG: FAD binding domain-containing protein [Hyphomicrobiaceae bacterium]